MRIYNLIIIDKELSYSDHSEEFNIGFFSSYEKTETTAEKYITQIQGFKDHNCDYRITEKRLIGCADGLIPTDVFIIYGWNENSELDEIDLIESDCFVSKASAEQTLDEMKAMYCRQNWCIDKYSIDECNWKDGFIRV